MQQRNASRNSLLLGQSISPPTQFQRPLDASRPIICSGHNVQPLITVQIDQDDLVGGTKISADHVLHPLVSTAVFEPHHAVAF
ncbi:MAG: hypothetical protein CMJ68_19355 [Planctomycetaceae bacterium]|nr:hypothetical protein [Planctomycetaceae bacterium]